MKLFVYIRIYIEPHLKKTCFGHVQTKKMQTILSILYHLKPCKNNTCTSKAFLCIKLITIYLLYDICIIVFASFQTVRFSKDKARIIQRLSRIGMILFKHNIILGSGYLTVLLLLLFSLSLDPSLDLLTNALVNIFGSVIPANAYC